VRQRTKTYIESLEKQLEELLNSSTETDDLACASLRQSNLELEKSIAELRQKIAIQPYLLEQGSAVLPNFIEPSFASASTIGKDSTSITRFLYPVCRTIYLSRADYISP
jgi:hypothetical protein